MEDSLSNGILDRWYARIILLGKEWQSEEVVVLRSECVDHVDYLFLWLPSSILPSSPVALLLCHCCLFGQVQRLWMFGRLQDMILERKLLLSILNPKADLGTICVANGFCGASERLAQDNGCPYIL